MISEYNSFYEKNNPLQNSSINTELIDASIIVSCRNEVNTLKKTIDSMMGFKSNLSFEIIIVDDGSTDGSCDFITEHKYKNVMTVFSECIGVSASRNLGARLSKGKYLFFCDAHISVCDYWIDKLIKTMEEKEAGAIIPAIKNMEGEDKGFGGTWNYNLNFIWLNEPEKNGSEVPLAPGCTIGIKKDVFQAIGGFDEYLKIYGVEDQEISLKLWLFGYKIVIDKFVEINHLFKVNNSYNFTYADLIYNYLCMAYFHFNYDNLVKTLEIFKNTSGFNIAFTKLVLNETLSKRRKEYFNKRRYDDNYFFKKFHIIF